MHPPNMCVAIDTCNALFACIKHCLDLVLLLVAVRALWTTDTITPTSAALAQEGASVHPRNRLMLLTLMRIPMLTRIFIPSPRTVSLPVLLRAVSSPLQTRTNMFLWRCRSLHKPRARRLERPTLEDLLSLTSRINRYIIRMNHLVISQSHLMNDRRLEIEHE